MAEPVKPAREKFILIAGPCVIESAELTLAIAKSLAAMAKNLGVTLIFKASYDKANRTSLQSYRGPGFSEGLRILAQVREETGVAVLSDVHSPQEAEQAGTVLDVLQIPAFLCRQTDLILAAARTGKIINLKKGQFIAPHDMEPIIAKAASVGQHIWVTERGTTFGYNNLIVDMRALAILRAMGRPVIFDATHSVQLPGAGVQSGGERAYVPVLARAAAGAGIDGLFLETHPEPEKALSDGATMWPLDKVEQLMQSVLAIHQAAKAYTA